MTVCVPAAAVFWTKPVCSRVAICFHHVSVKLCAVLPANSPTLMTLFECQGMSITQMILRFSKEKKGCKDLLETEFLKCNHKYFMFKVMTERIAFLKIIYLNMCVLNSL